MVANSICTILFALDGRYARQTQSTCENTLNIGKLNTGKGTGIKVKVPELEGEIYGNQCIS